MDLAIALTALVFAGAVLALALRVVLGVQRGPNQGHFQAVVQLETRPERNRTLLASGMLVAGLFILDGAWSSGLITALSVAVMGTYGGRTRR